MCGGCVMNGCCLACIENANETACFVVHALVTAGGGTSIGWECGYRLAFSLEQGTLFGDLVASASLRTTVTRVGGG